MFRICPMKAVHIMVCKYKFASASTIEDYRTVQCGFQMISVVSSVVVIGGGG